jgi:hypothetical protein
METAIIIFEVYFGLTLVQLVYALIRSIIDHR